MAPQIAFFVASLLIFLGFLGILLLFIFSGTALFFHTRGSSLTRLFITLANFSKFLILIPFLTLLFLMLIF